jgi:hydroxymethyl cephem carbamoyltransferase
MLVMGVKPGHTGAVAAVKDHTVLFSIEAEKDSFLRHRPLGPETLIRAAERLGEIPDVLALGGWNYHFRPTGENYIGVDDIGERFIRFFGKEVKFFASSHERSHIAMGIGMAPKDESKLRALLVWEGLLGHFYLVDERFHVVQRIEVLPEPGARWGFLFALADPTFPDQGSLVRLEDSGKLMALAAFGKAEDADADVIKTIDWLLNEEDHFYPAPKGNYSELPVYNAGVEAEVTKTAAALLTERIFELFARAAEEHLPAGVPLHISGGCGLNCDWNMRWRELGYFSSVFVPPCTDDSGSALGTAMDAIAAATGDPHVEWTVYSGLEFEWDADPDPTRWSRSPLDLNALADALSGGRVVAWVQGRWEIGPRALGNRSLLAEPFDAQTRVRLNHIKQRESYRPIAPCCRIEDAGKAFDADFEDPYMLYFRRVRMRELQAVSHVDGSARVQTVTREGNPPLHDLLSAFSERHGVGVLCNTSLNFKGYGFINRMSNLAQFCEERLIDDMVVGDAWFERSDR